MRFQRGIRSRGVPPVFEELHDAEAVILHFAVRGAFRVGVVRLHVGFTGESEAGVKRPRNRIPRHLEVKTVDSVLQVPHR